MTKQKLRNPNIFVSDTRLCVRNIPATTTDKQLRQIFLEAANDKKAKITEVVMVVEVVVYGVLGVTVDRLMEVIVH